MSDVLTQTKRNVRIFGCGGGGTNIAYALEKLRGNKELGFAEADIAYVDASRSNMRSDIPAKSVYLVDGIDGSGKVRSENHAEISLRIKDILLQFQPADLNIIIATLAGGSGSVIAPLLGRELLQRGVPTIFIGIGDTSTRLDTENTLKSIESFEAIAKATDTPTVLQYLQNSEQLSRSAIDTQVRAMVSSLCSLFSGENRELDSQDLSNWLKFSNPKVTTYRAQLATLHLLDGNDDFKDLGNIISVASLLNEGETITLPTRPEYATWGYIPRGAAEAVIKGAPYHFVIADGIIHDVIADLRGILAEMAAAQEARNAKNRSRSILSNTSSIDDTGLVL